MAKLWWKWAAANQTPNWQTRLHNGRNQSRDPLTTCWVWLQSPKCHCIWGRNRKSTLKSRLNCISPLSFQREITTMTFLRPWRPSLDVLHRKSHLIWGWFNFRKYLVLWPLDVSCDTIYLQGPPVTIFLAVPLQQSWAATLLERGVSGGSDYSRTTAENYVQVVIYETSLWCGNNLISIQSLDLT